MSSLTKYRGVRLGTQDDGRYYRIRLGRSLALVSVAGLPREWLDAYCRWYADRGERDAVQRLRQTWLATDHVVARQLLDSMGGAP